MANRILLESFAHPFVDAILEVQKTRDIWQLPAGATATGLIGDPYLAQDRPEAQRRTRDQLVALLDTWAPKLFLTFQPPADDRSFERGTCSQSRFIPVSIPQSCGIHVL